MRAWAKKQLVILSETFCEMAGSSKADSFSEKIRFCKWQWFLMGRLLDLKFSPKEVKEIWESDWMEKCPNLATKKPVKKAAKRSKKR